MVTRGIVVIGRNEGERLAACLRSLQGVEGAVVYVDSGSTDGSPERARALGAAVVELDASLPYSAARGRNAGFELLTREHPQLAVVQFVDGDCELVPCWLEAGTQHLAAHPDVAIVCGRRRERHPEASPWNRLADVEWDTPPGDSDACGGDALIRVEPFREVGGYDASLIAGEEPELCWRLRRAGWRIVRLDLEMTRHDAALERVSQWWRRRSRAGHAYAEAVWRHRRAPDPHRVRRLLSILFWAGLVPGAALLLLLPTRGASALLLAGWAWPCWRAYRDVRPRWERRFAALWAVTCVLGKLAELEGVASFLWSRGIRRRATPLIEYKPPATPARRQEPSEGAAAPDRAVLETLRTRSTRGALVSIGGQALSQILRLGGNLILARLLYPEAFGLMALVNLLMLGLLAVSDVGVQPALVRHARGDDRRFLDTAWTLQAGRGAVLWLLGSLAALPMALLYGEPALASLVPVACLGVLVTGLSSTKLATFTRHMMPGRVVAIELVSQAASLGVLVALAFVWRSVWVLVIGGLAAAALRCVLSHVALAGAINRPAWDRTAARELIAFGRWIVVSTALTFVALRVDVALLGRLLPVEVLGVYSIGIVLPTAVRDVLGQIGRFVVLPALSVSQRAGSGVFVANYLRMQRTTAPAALLGLAATAFAAPAFFIFLYDDRYHAAAWIAQLALAGTWFSYLAEVGGAALVAIGDSRAWAVCTALRAVVMTVGCAFGFALGALPGLILGSASASCITYLFTGRQLARHGVRTLPADLRYTALGAALGAGAGWLPHLAGDPSPRATALRSLLLGVALLAPLAAWVLLRLRRSRRLEGGSP